MLSAKLHNRRGNSTAKEVRSLDGGGVLETNTLTLQRINKKCWDGTYDGVVVEQLHHYNGRALSQHGGVAVELHLLEH